MRSLSCTVVFLMLVLNFSVSAEEATINSNVHLSPEIKQILTKEMLAIEAAMQQLVGTMAKGEWDKTASIGKQIQASFLLKKTLSKEQKQQLHKELPAQFIKLDQNFHHYAGMLAHAAEVKNMDVMSFYFYKMHESCLGCHAQFATERFPALQDSAATDHAGQH